MYRYSRGQPGQGGSLPRPAWGASGGAHGARASSPEPGGGTPLGSGTEPPKDRAESSDAQVILQLESELLELRNACAWKDQRIAELSRTDAPVARLRRDIRNLAMELHHTRKDLSESNRDLQDMQSQLARGESGAGGGRDSAAVSTRDIVDSPSASGGAPGAATAGASGASNASGSDRGAQLRGRVAELQDENRQLREKVVSLQTRQNGMSGEVTRDNSGTFSEGGSLHHARQPSGAASQRSVEQLNQAASATPPGAYSSLRSAPFSGTSGGGGASPTGSSVTPPAAAPAQPASAANATAANSNTADEPVRPVVYSSADESNQSTLGPTTLQGVGVVDGVSSVAKVLLQRIHSSVCAAHRRPQMALPTPGVQPGQMQMVPQVAMPQGNM